MLACKDLSCPIIQIGTRKRYLTEGREADPHGGSILILSSVINSCTLETERKESIRRKVLWNNDSFALSLMTIFYTGPPMIYLCIIHLRSHYFGDGSREKKTFSGLVPIGLGLFWLLIIRALYVRFMWDLHGQCWQWIRAKHVSPNGGKSSFNVCARL